MDNIHKSERLVHHESGLAIDKPERLSDEIEAEVTIGESEKRRIINISRIIGPSCYALHKVALMLACVVRMICIAIEQSFIAHQTQLCIQTE